MAAGALVLGIIVIATVGVYLLAVGAVVFVAWLVRVATKRGAEPVQERAPPPPPPPAAEYHPVFPVDPTVFHDASQTKAVAARVFEAWVGKLPMAPSRSIDLVRSIETRTRWIGRLATELEQRRVVECCEPAPGRQTIGPPPLDRRMVDPWNPPIELHRASRFICGCSSCRASGRVACPSCNGAGRRACASCGGRGRSYGTAANGAYRMLNCKSCRGKGNVVCEGCTRGKIDCPMCQRETKLACWLEVRSELRQDVQVEPDGAMTKAFAWGQDGTRATRDEIAKDARILDEVTHPRSLGLGDLPAAVPPDWRAESWPRIQARVEPGERVRRQAFMLLAVPSVSVSYAILGEQQMVVLEGLRMLAPPATGGELFGRRARMLGRLRLVLAALPAAAAVMCAARGDYFVTGRTAGLVAGVVGAAAVTAAIAYVVLWNATLGRRARRWAASAIAPVVLASTLAVAAEPRADHAWALIEAGQLGEAAAELRALGTPPDDPAWAELHLRKSLAASTCTGATAELHEIRADLPQRARAQAHANELAVAEAEAALRGGDADGAITALGCGREATSTSTRALRERIAAAQADRCLHLKNWTCALERAAATADAAAARAQVLAAIRAEADAHATAARAEPVLERRVERERAAIGLWREYLVGSPAAAAPPPLAALKAALARDEPALAKHHQIAQAREQAEIKRQLAATERERQQEARAAERERRRQAAEEARSNRNSGGLLCNDGTLSPTCSCGGPHRGCCSHHGGIAGCQ